MAAKKVEVDERVVAIQSQMDEKVAEVHQVEQEQAELQALLDARIQQLKDSFQGKFDILNGRKEYLITEIRALFDQVPHTETKTQAKVSLLSGDVVVKKAGLKIDYDKKVLLEIAESEVQKYENRKVELKEKLNELEDRIDAMAKEEPLYVMQDIDNLYKERNEVIEELASLSCEWLSYVKSKEVKDFDWSAYKEKLEIQEDGSIVNVETGEVLETQGLKVLPVAEQVVIK